MFIVFLLIFFLVIATEIPDSTLKKLDDEIVGSITYHSDRSYQSSSKQWNARFDEKTPRAIIFCENTNDVQLTVGTLRVYDTCISVRSAGHSFPGFSVMDGCIVIDVSNVNHMFYSLGKETVTVGAGTNFWDFTHFIAPFNRTTVHGFGPSVGFGGYTQGGGVGLTHRKYGLAVDNLVRAEVVLHDGSVVNATVSDNTDLFWALRGGGGGNFGIVTEYEFQTFDASSQVLYVMLEWPFAKDTVRDTAITWQNYVNDASCSRDFGLYWRINGNPVLGELGTKVQIYGIWTGELTDGQELLNNFIALFPEAPSTTITPMMLDQAYEKFMAPYRHTPHTGFYLQSRLVQTPMESVSFEALAAQLDQLHFLETFALIWLDPLGGAVSDVAPADTAFYWRNSFANFAIFVFYLTESGKQPAKQWMTDTFEKVGLADDSVYINFNYNVSNWQSAYYGENYGRLQEIKTTVDPHNMWNYPQSIEPLVEVEKNEERFSLLEMNNIGGSGACIGKNCSSQAQKCMLDKQCRTALFCIARCGQDDQTCTYGCELDFANDVFDAMFTCMVDHGCIPHYPPDPFTPPTNLERGYTTMNAMAGDGAWWIVRGYSPAYDKFPCQYLSFTAEPLQDWVYTANFEYETDKYAILQANISTDGSAKFVLDYTEHGLHHLETWYLIAATSDATFGYESRVFRYQGKTPIMDYDGGIWFQYSRDYNASITPIALNYIADRLALNSIDVNEWSYTDNSGCTNGPERH